MKNLSIGATCLLALACSGDPAVGSSEGTSSTQSPLSAMGGAPSACTVTGFAGVGTGTLQMETEVLPVAQVSTGDTLTIMQSSIYSWGQSTRLNANAAGDYVTFGPISCPVNMVGPIWNVQLRAMSNSFAAKIRLEYAPTSSGPWRDLTAVLDLYSTTAELRTFDMGGIILQDTPAFIQLAVVGKNPAGSGYFANVDWIQFRPVH